MKKCQSNLFVGLFLIISFVSIGVVSEAAAQEKTEATVGFPTSLDSNPNWDWQYFNFCPAGDAEATFIFDFYGNDGITPNYTPEPYFEFICWDGSVAFANERISGRSEFFYPTSHDGNRYTFDFSLAAGINVDFPMGEHPDYLSVRVHYTLNGNSGWWNFHGMKGSSPDLSGDLNVNLIDVSRFSIIFNGEYDVRGDYDGDGEMTLSDVAFFASHMSH